MKKTLLMLFTLGLLAGAASAGKINLGAGRTAYLTVPESWQAAELPAATPGLSPAGVNARFVPRSSSNDTVFISFLIVPDDRFGDRDNLQTLIEESTQEFAAGSVEGKAILKVLKLAGKSGYSCTFTDANLVGKPTVKDDYKTLTSCFVYLGDHVMLNATVFSDDPAGKGFAEGLRLLKSISLQLPKDTI